MRKSGFDEVVSSCLKAVWNQSAWDDALGKIASYLDNDAITLENFGSDLDSIVDFRSHGIDTPSIAAYLEYFHATNPRHPHLKQTVAGESLYDNKILSEHQMDKHEFYNELLQPFGLRYFISNTLVRTQDSLVLLAQHIPTRKSHATKEQVVTLERIAPVVAQTYQLSRNFGQLQTAQDTYKDIIDHLGVGIVILDKQGGIERSNSIADRLCSAHQCINYTTNGIRLKDQAIDKLLASSITNALKAELQPPSDPVLVSDHDNHRFLRIDVLPMRSSHQTVDFFELSARQNRVLLVVRDIGSAEKMPDGVLKFCFSLTNREIELARSLVKGNSLSRHAELRQVKITTVRTQFASLRAKLGARTQADVMRQLIPLLSA